MDSSAIDIAFYLERARGEVGLLFSALSLRSTAAVIHEAEAVARRG